MAFTKSVKGLMPLAINQGSVLCSSIRTFSATSSLLMAKTRRPKDLDGVKETRHRPFDRRWPINPKDVSPIKRGGSEGISKEIGHRGEMPKPPGYFDKEGKFHLEPDMIPEFVVPDLKGFDLKPYVSYNVEEINQSEFTAKNLFDECYGKKIIQDYRDGKLDADEIEKKKEEFLKRPS